MAFKISTNINWRTMFEEHNLCRIAFVYVLSSLHWVFHLGAIFTWCLKNLTSTYVERLRYYTVFYMPIYDLVCVTTVVYALFVVRQIFSRNTYKNYQFTLYHFATFVLPTYIVTLHALYCAGYIELPLILIRCAANGPIISLAYLIEAVNIFLLIVDLVNGIRCRMSRDRNVTYGPPEHKPDANGQVMK
ncbi:MAG: hypothetical protein Faunusvirus18_14 [Faunusvirus sp.]|jgi:hypothetical protein|uniref:Uncharacterized protein n=1 Tax=Faunusvirus sp. TaxID=2487766 RepID=A0A3G5A1Z2_9VIRU|nr:MAG: hypothetical protein Faunusvirus18_14 [Faunusvirus sp.]